MSNSTHGGSRKNAGPPRRNVKLDKETALLVAQLKRAREGVTEEQIIVELRALAFMVSNWQALSNHAEVFAPQLIDNAQWTALKQSLEERTEAIGVSAFIDVVGERYRQQIEAQEE